MVISRDNQGNEIKKKDISRSKLLVPSSSAGCRLASALYDIIKT